MTKTELKNKISEFMKKKYGDDIKNSTDLSTVVPEDKVDSCINALISSFIGKSRISGVLLKALRIATLTSVTYVLHEDFDILFHCRANGFQFCVSQ